MHGLVNTFNQSVPASLTLRIFNRNCASFSTFGGMVAEKSELCRADGTSGFAHVDKPHQACGQPRRVRNAKRSRASHNRVHEIKQTARRCDQYVGAATSAARRAEGDAPDDNNLPQPEIPRVRCDAFADLHCKFAGRGEDQGAIVFVAAYAARFSLR